MVHHGLHVLVAAAGEVDHHQVFPGKPGRTLEGLGQGVGRFQRGDDAFQAAAVVKGLQRLMVGAGHVFDALDLVQPGVLGADARVVEAGGNRMRVGDLAVFVLQEEGAVAVQHARGAAGHAGGVLAGVDAVAGRFDADDLHALVIEERVEQADGVGAAADAGDQRVGQAAFLLHDLLAHFVADHRLEVADHGRVGVRAGGGADQVEGVVDVRHPVAQRLVHGVLEGAGAGGDRDHRGAEQAHAEDVGLLAIDVGGAHVDHALHAEARGHGGGGHAVHAGAGLGDDALLAHALGQEDLADAVVDLVRAGVVQVFALQVDLRAAEVLGEALGVVQRAGAADVVALEVGQLLEKGRIVLGLFVFGGQLVDQRHQGFGDELAAEAAEQPAVVRAGAV